MLAARAYQGETNLRLEEVPKPTAGPGEVVIKVEAAGMAPGFLLLWKLGFNPILPQTLGNQAAGFIEEIGAGVTSFAPGDRVRLYPDLTCGRCEYCLTDREQMCSSQSMIGHAMYGKQGKERYEHYRHGGLAEYVLAPESLVDPISETLSFDAAAKIYDVADAVRAMHTAHIPPGGTLVITAATGVVGASIVRLAKRFGVGRLIAVARSAERLEELRALDPDLIDVIALEDVDFEKHGGLTGRIRQLVPEGPDSVIDLLPEGPGTWQAFASMKMGGTAVAMGGNPAPPSLGTLAIMVNCWRILGNRACTREDARQVAKWLEDGSLQIDDLITHRFDLKDIAEAERLVTERYEPARMIVIHP